MTLDNCPEGARIWKTISKWNPTGDESTYPFTWLSKVHADQLVTKAWVSVTLGFPLATSPLLPERYYGDHNPDSVTSVTPLATDGGTNLVIHITAVQTEEAMVGFLGTLLGKNVKKGRATSPGAA